MMKFWHARKQLRFCWVCQRIVDALKHKTKQKNYIKTLATEKKTKKKNKMKFDMQEDNG
jgi:hypothetical protein